MALTPSTMLALGTALPPFELPQVSGGTFHHTDLNHRPVLLMVLCAHCPFVKHVEPEITRLEQDYAERIQLVGVSSNSLITHPQDGPEQLADQARRHGWRFPYLLDEQQTLARDLRAALDAVLGGTAVDPDQRPSVGCNVKWNPGHEPNWFC